MGDFDFQVCVLARHPQADVSELSARLGRVPAHASKRGAVIVTPKGTRPGGIYADSRCLVEFASNEDGTLAECLGAAADALEPHREFIAQLIRNGGEVQVFARWYPNGDTGETLPPYLLRKLGSLGVQLGFNVFGVPPQEEQSSQ